MKYHIEKVASPEAIVGEGPVWNPEEAKLYWTDIQRGKLFKYNPIDNSNEIIHNGIEV